MNTSTSFRDEVRQFLSEKLTPDLQRAGRLEAGIYAERPVAEAWLAILNEQGWAVPGWPIQWGGTGWSAEQHAI
jgi:alkylation response protein AidB-like acyl-CoA dehydrogenase